jgi:hypothetical protein
MASREDPIQQHAGASPLPQRPWRETGPSDIAIVVAARALMVGTCGLMGAALIEKAAAGAPRQRAKRIAADRIFFSDINKSEHARAARLNVIQNLKPITAS